MRYANSDELSRFHDSFLAMCEKHADRKEQRAWGFPHGVIACDTYRFNTGQRTLYVGHHDIGQGERWWVPIRLEDQSASGQLQIDFELCIPKQKSMHLSVHYAVDSNDMGNILHKGKFTVGRGGVSMSTFFAYYRRHPGRWRLMEFNNHTYLVLGRVNLDMTEADFAELLESLADFAKYIPGFKDTRRYSGPSQTARGHHQLDPGGH